MSALPVKLDEDLSSAVGEPLSALGHEVRTVVGQGWRGVGDAALWKMLSQEAVYFITADKGFGDIRTYPPGTHAGVLVLRPDRESIVEYRALVMQVLASYSIDDLRGAVTVCTPRGIRVRRAPTAGT